MLSSQNLYVCGHFKIAILLNMSQRNICESAHTQGGRKGQIWPNRVYLVAEAKEDSQVIDMEFSRRFSC